MEMHLIQIIGILFGVFAFSRVVIRFKDNDITKNEFVIWSVIWLLIILVAFVPGITGFFSKLFGVGRGIDFMVYMSIIFLFYMTFRVYIKLEKIEQDITGIVREVALNKKNKK
ncbi:DUF2304 family protein [Candidatus Woesearchaeota archaeon]|nr:MAG: DUF2304 family protein [Candidatus Woesearchaeota archaeon]